MQKKKKKTIEMQQGAYFEYENLKIYKTLLLSLLLL